MFDFFMCVVPNTFIETLRDRMFKPSLSTIIPDDTKYVISYFSLLNPYYDLE